MKFQTSMVWGQNIFEFIYGCSIHGSLVTARNCPHKTLLRDCSCGVQKWHKTLEDLEKAVMDFNIHTRSEKFHEEQKRICTYREFIRILEEHLKM